MTYFPPAFPAITDDQLGALRDVARETTDTRLYALATIALASVGEHYRGELLTSARVEAARHACAEIVATQPSLLSPRRARKRSTSGGRFENGIELRCCGEVAKCLGNLSLRGAGGATATRIAYECGRCHKRLQVVDQWGDHPDAATLAEIDNTA